MFFITYLRRELRRRMRQAIFIAIGLAIGVGLVITVMGASAGVRGAQAKVLRSLYGVGTDITVTQKPTRPAGSGGGHTTINVGPGGSQICTNGKCHTGSGTLDTLASPNSGSVSASTVAAVARLHGVTAAAGGLNLTDNQVVIPVNAGAGNLQPPTSFTVAGTDISHPRLGPLSVARISSGRAFTAADENRDVAVVDSNYAIAHGLKVGSTVTVAKVKFTVIGIATQPEGSSPPDVYLPVARAQALAIDPGTGKSLAGQVNTIYVTAASATGVGAVQKEIERLLPSATVTTSADLASEITGSLASTAKLANDLGRWLAVLVLIAAFAVASLLTMAAVARRVREFGTLKALGWRSFRIVSQVLGESLTTGIAGGLAGVGLGFAGVAIIDKIAPKLSATLPSASGGGGSGLQTQSLGAAGGAVTSGGGGGHATVAVAMSASVTIGAITLAVLLAVAGGLLAGSFGGWRAARLRPAEALARVA